MAPIEEMHAAMINRSIRTIKAELEYLCDASVITPATLTDLLSRIPAQTSLHAPISVGALPGAIEASPTANSPPTAGMNNLSVQNGRANSTNKVNEKQSSSYYDAPAQPPPAYNNPPPQANWPPLAQATALYAYTSTDVGDLELQPKDHVTVTEYMNAEWWKGRNSRTNQEGIFPRSYVKVVEDKASAAPDMQPPVSNQYGNNYGNAPLEVSQMGNGQGTVPSKFESGGKKFGKKLGNAAIFGAGATIGGNIVNSIF